MLGSRTCLRTSTHSRHRENCDDVGAKLRLVASSVGNAVRARRLTRMRDLRFLALLVVVLGAACSTTHGTDEDTGVAPGIDAPDFLVDAAFHGDAYVDPFAPPDAHWVIDAVIDARPTIRCGGELCADHEACCFADGRCFDPATEDCRSMADAGMTDAGDDVCTSHSDCDPGFFCTTYAYACLGEGYCQPLPDAESCSRDHSPVCGCDGVTYESGCAALAAGARIVRQQSNGGCGNPIIGIHGALHTGPIACGNDSSHCGGTECCAASGLCLPSDCPECCYVTPPQTYACNSDELCLRADGNSFCDASACDSELGACVRRPSVGECPGVFDPVCGCDGTTYVNACLAQSAGVRVSHDGECDG